MDRFDRTINTIDGIVAIGSLAAGVTKSIARRALDNIAEQAAKSARRGLNDAVELGSETLTPPRTLADQYADAVKSNRPQGDCTLTHCPNITWAR